MTTFVVIVKELWWCQRKAGPSTTPRGRGSARDDNICCDRERVVVMPAKSRSLDYAARTRLRSEFVTFLIAPKFGAENTGTYNAKNTEKSKKSHTLGMTTFVVIVKELW
jgi:hypothetical protein